MTTWPERVNLSLNHLSYLFPYLATHCLQLWDKHTYMWTRNLVDIQFGTGSLCHCVALNTLQFLPSWANWDSASSSLLICRKQVLLPSLPSLNTLKKVNEVITKNYHEKQMLFQSCYFMTQFCDTTLYMNSICMYIFKAEPLPHYYSHLIILNKWCHAKLIIRQKVP